MPQPREIDVFLLPALAQSEQLAGRIAVVVSLGATLFALLRWQPAGIAGTVRAVAEPVTGLPQA